ncbi:MAG: RidA family protein [Acidimicrobiia bacterium]|jgi:enamine deaminase RidA (YjgF/YER057c/UK114 family)
MERTLSRHHLFDPEGMAPASGFSYGAVAAAGRLLHLAGMTGHHADGSIDDGLVEQFAQACSSVARVLEEGGGAPTDLVSMTIYTSDIEDYRSRLREIGEAYQRAFGKHYPPMALFGITELFDPAAKVELVCVAVVPD